MGTWGGRGGAGRLWAAKPRDGNRKKPLLGSVAPNCCHPVPQLVGSQRPMGSGNGRSLSDLSTEPRRRWRIYEPRRGSSLPDSKSLRGGEKTRLLLSSTPSIPRGNLWLGDIPGLWCPPPARLRDAGTRQGGPYPWGWCQTPAGCSTRGCRTSCRTRTRWLPARSRDVGRGGLASSPAKPHRLPPETPWDDGHGPPHPACKADGDIRGPWRPISARCTISHCKG